MAQERDFGAADLGLVDLDAPVSERRTWPAGLGIALGLALWAVGIFGVFGETSFASLLALPFGCVVFLTAAYFWVRQSWERRFVRTAVELDSPDQPWLTPTRAANVARATGPEPGETILFFVLAGGGLAVLGFALAAELAPATAVALAAAGVGLLAFSPRAIRASWSQR